MAKCPFATWQLISGPVGPFVSGPFKIVHHTTEGSSAAGAFSAFQANKSDPHFTVDSNKIYQHIDTALAARSLRNASGGVQTNKDSAIQIEVVGFAAHAKNPNTLLNIARLCRWIEHTHGVVKKWPNGIPKTATSAGHDPGGHNRNASNWDSISGHYGHCHVPENTHWDPGYRISEVNVIMESEFNSAGQLLFMNEMQTSHPAIFGHPEMNMMAFSSAKSSNDGADDIKKLSDSAELEFELY